MKIVRLRQYTLEEQRAFGHHGYTSPMKYQVTKESIGTRTTIAIELVPLKQPYVKFWEEDPEDFQLFDPMIESGHSLGAYIEDELVAVAIAEPRTWNNTLFLWNLHVAERHQRKRIGSRLLQELIELARRHGFRAIVLETQNTNVPAIQFYKSFGFDIEGIDLALYSNNDLTDGEIAFFMTLKL